MINQKRYPKTKQVIEKKLEDSIFRKVELEKLADFYDNNPIKLAYILNKIKVVNEEIKYWDDLFNSDLFSE